MTSQQAMTQLLAGAGRGEKEALDALMPLVYAKLRQMAGAYLRRERAGHTLQTTALVHEAYLRLVNQQKVDWENHAQFFGVAAQMMRRILINHARDHKADKRGGGARPLSLGVAEGAGESPDFELTALDLALGRLAAFDPDLSRVVELRYFGGLTIEETAAVMGVSPSTVKADWLTAKAWLYGQLAGRE
jgi:RNA polymerase sigma factor (TIGR02999 family)